MKTQELELDAEQSGEFDTTSYKVKQTASVFQHLSSTLYSDKVGAVIRETSTNAVDSHIVSGNPDQFEVQLPTHLDNTFKVRDYGTGLSEEDCREIYTTYFESTKTNTNDLNGTFGLGSKSPFSMCDSYSVISYFEGVKYSFLAHKDANGFPQFSKLGEQNTDEPNGLEVSLVVPKEEVSRFQEKAYYIYRVFENPPKINIGSVTQRIEEFKTASRVHKNVRVLQTPSRGELYVVMSNVAYPYSKPNDLYDFCYENTIFVEIPNGSASFDLGREKITANDFVDKLVEESIEEYIAEYLKETQQEIDDAAYHSDAYDIYASCKISDRHKAKYLTYKGSTFPTFVTLSEEYLSLERNYSKKVYKEYYLKFFYNNLSVVYRYTDKKDITRCTYAMKNQGKRKIILLTDAQIKECGINPASVKNVDDLPEPIRKPRTVSQTVKCFRVDGTNHRSYDGPINSGAVYVTIFGKTINSKSHNSRTINEVIRELRDIGIDIPEVFIIRTRITEQKKFKKLQCKEFDAYVTEKLKDHKLVKVLNDYDYNGMDLQETVEVLGKVGIDYKIPDCTDYHCFQPYVDPKNLTKVKYSDLKKEVVAKYPALKVLNYESAIKFPEITKKVLGL